MAQNPIRPITEEEYESIAKSPFVSVEEVKKDPEKKIYLILYYYFEDDNNDNNTSWEFITGRTAARESIIHHIEDIDIHESLILVESVTLESIHTVCDFMIYLDEHFHYDDEFDIYEYIKGDDVEEEIEVSRKNDKKLNPEILRTVMESKPKLLNPFIALDDLETEDV